MKITAEACRAARAILKWSMRDLARESGVSWTVINRLEGGGGVRSSTVERISTAFAARGVELVVEDARTGALIARPTIEEPL